ncbi:MAG: STAS domain-containing protein [Devosia sp.]
MEISVSTFSTFKLVTIAGRLDGQSAAGLNAALMACIDGHGARLIIDLSGLGQVTPAGLGGVLVAAQMTRASGGQMRICGAERRVQTLLEGLSYPGLIWCDHSLAASIAAMSHPARRSRPAPARPTAPCIELAAFRRAAATRPSTPIGKAVGRSDDCA